MYESSKVCFLQYPRWPRNPGGAAIKYMESMRTLHGGCKGYMAEFAPLRLTVISTLRSDFWNTVVPRALELLAKLDSLSIFHPKKTFHLNLIRRKYFVKLRKRKPKHGWVRCVLARCSLLWQPTRIDKTLCPQFEKLTHEKHASLTSLFTTEPLKCAFTHWKSLN